MNLGTGVPAFVPQEIQRLGYKISIPHVDMRMKGNTPFIDTLALELGFRAYSPTVKSRCSANGNLLGSLASLSKQCRDIGEGGRADGRHLLIKNGKGHVFSLVRQQALYFAGDPERRSAPWKTR